MPVTRDLSGGKRTAILRWLRELGPDGRPLLGVAAGLEAAVAADVREPVPPELVARGGKGAAAARRLESRR